MASLTLGVASLLGMAYSHGTPSVRVSQTWGRQISDERGAEASAHHLARLPACQGGNRSALQFFFLFAAISLPSISSGEITSKPWRKTKELLFFCMHQQKAGFITLNAEKNHTLQEQQALEQGNPFYFSILLWSERDCTSVSISLSAVEGVACSSVNLSKGKV